MKDHKGHSVNIGDNVRVLRLPEVSFSEDEAREVKTMLGEIFTVESIADGYVEITKWWKKGETAWSHTLFLSPDEFERVTTPTPDLPRL